MHNYQEQNQLLAKQLAEQNQLLVEQLAEQNILKEQIKFLNRNKKNEWQQGKIPKLIRPAPYKKGRWANSGTKRNCS